MRFLVDAQLPPALARLLADAGHIAEHVVDCGLATASDRQIWDHARVTSAVIITKDEDFAVRRAVAIDGPAVVWIRRGNTTRRDLLSWFKPILPVVIDALLNDETLIEII